MVFDVGVSGSGRCGCGT